VVVLDHSAYIQSVTCVVDVADSSVSDLTIQFTTTEGYLYAKSSWLAQKSNLLLATYVNGCGSAGDQRTYWMVKTMSFNDAFKSVVVTAVEKHFNDCVTDLDIEWGEWCLKKEIWNYY
jgi:hypothetical protein